MPLYRSIPISFYNNADYSLIGFLGNNIFLFLHTHTRGQQHERDEEQGNLFYCFHGLIIYQLTDYTVH